MKVVEILKPKLKEALVVMRHKPVAILLAIIIAMASTKVYLNVKDVHAYLPAELRTGSSEIRELAMDIRNLADGQVMILHINSFGGHVAAEKEIANALKLTKGKVIAHIDGEADSAAAMIALECHGLVVGPKSTMLFHVPAYSDFMGNRIAIPLDDPDMIEAIAGFRKILTQEEIDRLLKDANDFIILDSKQIKERLHLEMSKNNR